MKQLDVVEPRRTGRMLPAPIAVSCFATVHGNAKNTRGATGHIANAPLPFGPGGNAPIAGVLDEVRIATTVRTAGWIATEHANQSSPTTFYTVGPDQAAP